MTAEAMGIGIDPRFFTEVAAAAHAGIAWRCEAECVQESQFEARNELCRIAAAVDGSNRACQEIVDLRHRKIRLAKRIDQFRQPMSGCKCARFDDPVPV